jgi:hypothetical protein
MSYLIDEEDPPVAVRGARVRDAHDARASTDDVRATARVVMLSG